MGLLDTIGDFFGQDRYDHFSQRQTEAFIDALTFAMVVDGEIAPKEEDELAEALDEFDWQGPPPLEVYVDESLDRAEACDNNPARTDEYVADISARLDEQQTREEVYYVCAKVACADETILESERVMLNNLVEAFEIDRDRLALMTEELQKSLT